MEELLISLLIRSSLFYILFSAQALAGYVDYAKAQHAGEIGTIAFGVGKKFTCIYSLEAFYGRVPKGFGGIEINTFAIKNNFNLYRFIVKEIPIDLYTGINLYHVTGRRYKSSTRSEFPDGYYRIGSLRGLLYLGQSISFGKKHKHSAYLESGLNDIVIVNFINNSDTINPIEYVSMAIGYSYRF